MQTNLPSITNSHILSFNKPMASKHKHIHKGLEDSNSIKIWPVIRELH